VKFVFDECMPRPFAPSLRTLFLPKDYAILDLVDDLHQGGVPDPDWIASMSANHEWKIITRDTGMKTRALERQAWQNAGQVIFFLEGTWASASYFEMTWRIVRWWPHIVDAAQRADLGSTFSVPYRGRVGPLAPTSGRIAFPKQKF
jgi:hypothetical protein